MFKSDINYPKVSVIVPFYNNHETIDETLRSIEAQTYPSIEIIVVDDGSNKYNNNALKQILLNRPYVQLIEQSNKGPASARNTGAYQASGVYFCFLDSDDVIKPQYLSACVEVLKDPEIKLVYTKAELFGARKGHWDLPPYEGLKSILLGNRIPNMVALQRSKDFFELDGFDESFLTHEDWDYWIRLLQRGGNVVRIPEVLFMYRKRLDGTSLIDQLEREPRKIQEDWQKVYDKHRSLYLKHNLGYYDLMVQLDKMHQSEHMLSTHLKDVREFKNVLESQLKEANDSKDLLESQLQELNDSKHLLENQLKEANDSKHLLENQLQSVHQSAQTMKVQLDETIQLNGSLDRRYQKYKKLSTVRLIKPFIKIEQAISSANTLRRGFRRLVKEKGSIGKAYQYLRRLKKTQNIKGVKTLLRAQVSQNSQSRTISATNINMLGANDRRLLDVLANIPKTISIARNNQGFYSIAKDEMRYTYVEPSPPRNIESILSNMKEKPLFSIVVPVYNTPVPLLNDVLSSIMGQWYPHWELILVNDSSSSELTNTRLKEISNPQIQVINLPHNLGISGATNKGMDVAQGDFIVFMDHDDELTVDCLYELALCVNAVYPDFIYSDEDKINERGEFDMPHFKPDWSPDTMMSTMFTCHVSAVRRSLLDKVGGLRTGYDGCQDWDFVLRVTEHTNRISHIPKILYHWRIIPGSVAGDIAAKDYVLDASKRVREDALSRRGLSGEVEALTQVPGYFRVNYHLMEDPLISIIIPTRDNYVTLKQCIDSIVATTVRTRYEVVIIDNGSVDAQTLTYLDQLRLLDNFKVIRHEIEFNFSELCNTGADHATGDFLLFLNDDTEVLQSDWLQRMGGYAQQSHVGAVGAKLVYPKTNKIQHAGVINVRTGPVHAFLGLEENVPSYFMRNLLEYNWLAVTGACLMVQRQKFQAVAGFDESLPVAYNDVDLCMRLHKHGFYNVVCQAVKLIHHESVSRGLDHIDDQKRKRLEQDKTRLYDLNSEFFEFDPFYNINLHPSSVNFEVVW